jgi:hypothetical protein
MTKDLAICAHGPSAPRDSYLMTQPFMDAVRGAEGAARLEEPPQIADRPLSTHHSPRRVPSARAGQGDAGEQVRVPGRGGEAVRRCHCWCVSVCASSLEPSSLVISVCEKLWRRRRGAAGEVMGRWRRRGARLASDRSQQQEQARTSWSRDHVGSGRDRCDGAGARAPPAARRPPPRNRRHRRRA